MNRETRYYSTNLNSPQVSFKEALLKGLAPDGGLYFPVAIPELETDELESVSEMSYPELASLILWKFIGNDISREELSEICREVYTFNIPLEFISGTSYIMRLDQGPTGSFKDFAALAMGRLMQHLLAIANKHITILTATSGDTGSAVANAFYRLDNIRVIILFPAEEVTEIQRKQMTTLGANIDVVAVNGKFDDCQRFVKTAFMEQSLNHLNLSSANSINIGRLIPQSVYYLWAWAQLARSSSTKAVFSVPCGNFGNLAGGLIAAKMGLPVERFVISTNLNDEVPLFLRTGVYKPVVPSRNCISSAMNVGHPSNLPRIVSMYNGIMDEKGHLRKSPDLEKMRNELSAFSFTDDETREAIFSFFRSYGTFLEPHGAVAWLGLQEYLRTGNPENQTNQINISLETAHPAKFGDEIRKVLGKEPKPSDSLARMVVKNEDYIYLENNYNAFKEFLFRNY